MTLHPANQRYRDAVLTAPYDICIERARYWTQSYQATEGRPPARRAARALAHTLRNMSLWLRDEELLAGNRASSLVAAVLPVERGEFNTLLELELEPLKNREVQPYCISPDDERELMEDILPYWRGRTVRDRKKQLWQHNGLYFRPSFNPWTLYRRYRALDHARIRAGTRVPGKGLRYGVRGLKELLFNNPALVMNVFDVQGHLILGHRNVLQHGFAGIRERALERREQVGRDGDIDGVHFLDGVIISCEAVREFAGRVADLAALRAGETTSPERHAELAAIEARCRHVPWNPPRDFAEAVQSLWLTQVTATVAQGMAAIFAVGRIDQHLYPYYANDLADGRTPPEQATRLLEELLIKLAHNLLLLPFLGKRTGNELGSDSAAPTVGGLGRDGEDATNALSYLVLDAFNNVKSLGNSFTIRLSEKAPVEFWRKALDTYRHTSGAALFNDALVVRALVNSGTALEDARDYGVIGCVEPTSDGDTFGCTSGNDISLTAALEMALLDGHLRVLGRTVGPRTGDPRRFATFDELLTAFRTQVIFEVETVVKGTNLKDQAYQELLPNPLVSCTLTGCVENARDATHGGARYNFGSVSARGLGTTVDSLAAIRHHVYERRDLPMAHLLRMLETNFQGEETWQARLANRAPKFGADDERADALAREVVDFFCREVARHRTIRGGPFRPGFFSYGMHVVEGLFLGATANGRLAGQPVSNSFSPSNGSESQGPTGVLRSVSKIDHGLISNGCAVNMKFVPELFKGPERLDKMVALVRAYFREGGMELSPNVVCSETLKRAQRHPEEYRDLAVRVSGYSALFCDLGKPLQDEIISRTEFGKI